MIVLDTHVIVWNALEPGKLSQAAKDAIVQANSEGGIIFCDISLWEIAMLISKERVKVAVDYQEFITLVLESNKYLVQEITPEIAGLSVSLPESINKDPADRIIAATAIVNKVPLVTADKDLLRSDEIVTIW